MLLSHLVVHMLFFQIEPNEYTHYNPSNQILTGERTKQVFRLGDKIEVRVASVDVLERKIDLQLGRSKFVRKASTGERRKSRSMSNAESPSVNKQRKKGKLGKKVKRKAKIIRKNRRKN